jgi:hypothetical protein
LAKLPATGAEMWRVRTMAGGELQRGAGQRHQPGVGRAVGVDHVGARRRELPTHQRKQAGDGLEFDRQRGDRHTEARRLGGHARVGRAGDADLMAALDQAARLFEDADLLSAPATGGLGVKDFHNEDSS